MANKKTSPEDRIVGAALRLAQSQDWQKLTLDQIAKAAKLSTPQVKEFFADKEAILPAIIHMISLQTARTVGKVNARATPHDRLFEVMMARFDQLQIHRKAILGIMAATRRDPQIGRRLVPGIWKAMEASLAVAHLKTETTRQPIVAGLFAIYLITLFCWQSDETPDMSKTMATLDRHLRRAGKLAEIFFRTR